MPLFCSMCGIRNFSFLFKTSPMIHVYSLSPVASRIKKTQSKRSLYRDFPILYLQANSALCPVTSLVAMALCACGDSTSTT